MKHTACISKSLLARTQRLEISGSFRRDISIKAKFDTTQWITVGSDVKVDSVGDFRRGGVGGEEVGEEVHLEGGGRG